MYGTFGRGITKYTVIYGVYIRFWPALIVVLIPVLFEAMKRSSEQVQRVPAHTHTHHVVQRVPAIIQKYSPQSLGAFGAAF